MDPTKLEAEQQRLNARMREVHAFLYAGCAWRNRDDALVVNGWRWYGCADHAPTTDSGMPSAKMVAAARGALEVAK